MQRTTLMLELEPRQVKALLAEDVDPEAVLSAVEEFHWQLASAGDHEALELMSRYG